MSNNFLSVYRGDGYSVFGDPISKSADSYVATSDGGSYMDILSLYTGEIIASVNNGGAPKVAGHYLTTGLGGWSCDFTGMTIFQGVSLVTEDGLLIHTQQFSSALLGITTAYAEDPSTTVMSRSLVHDPVAAGGVVVVSGSRTEILLTHISSYTNTQSIIWLTLAGDVFSVSAVYTFPAPSWRVQKVVRIGSGVYRAILSYGLSSGALDVTVYSAVDATSGYGAYPSSDAADSPYVIRDIIAGTKSSLVPDATMSSVISGTHGAVRCKSSFDRSQHYLFLSASMAPSGELIGSGEPVTLSITDTPTVDSSRILVGATSYGMSVAYNSAPGPTMSGIPSGVAFDSTTLTQLYSSYSPLQSTFWTSFNGQYEL